MKAMEKAEISLDVIRAKSRSGEITSSEQILLQGVTVDSMVDTMLVLSDKFGSEKMKATLSDMIADGDASDTQTTNRRILSQGRRIIVYGNYYPQQNPGETEDSASENFSINFLYYPEQ